MGMRRNIALDYGQDKKIYLYTHWGAEGLEEVLASSLERGRGRWGDDSYLARVISTDVTKDAGDDITGYGLAPYLMDDEFPTLEVSLRKRTVNGIPFDDFINRPQMFAI